MTIEKCVWKFMIEKNASQQNSNDKYHCISCTGLDHSVKCYTPYVERPVIDLRNWNMHQIGELNKRYFSYVAMHPDKKFSRTQYVLQNWETEIQHMQQYAQRHRGQQ